MQTSTLESQSRAQETAPRHEIERQEIHGGYIRPEHRPEMRRASSTTADQSMDLRGLGWFAIGLGAAEMLVPGAITNCLGVSRRPLLMRALGAREIASGVGLLAGQNPAGWLWARAAGDVMDMALVVASLRSPTARRGRIAP
jgi:hypothetical protein